MVSETIPLFCVDYSKCAPIISHIKDDVICNKILMSKFLSTGALFSIHEFNCK